MNTTTHMVCSIEFIDSFNYQIINTKSLFKSGRPWPWLYVVSSYLKDYWWAMTPCIEKPWYSESWLLDYGWLLGRDYEIACTALGDPLNPNLLKFIWKSVPPKIDHLIPLWSHCELSMNLIMKLRVQSDTYLIYPIWFVEQIPFQKPINTLKFSNIYNFSTVGNTHIPNPSEKGCKHLSPTISSYRPRSCK